MEKPQCLLGLQSLKYLCEFFEREEYFVTLLCPLLWFGMNEASDADLPPSFSFHMAQWLVQYYCHFHLLSQVAERRHPMKHVGWPSQPHDEEKDQVQNAELELFLTTTEMQIRNITAHPKNKQTVGHSKTKNKIKHGLSENTSWKVILIWSNINI